jgi:2',3'-cyclic-nucleotide 2'-phosphodiesterase (5'-nucleotidase family)
MLVNGGVQGTKMAVVVRMVAAFVAMGLTVAAAPVSAAKFKDVTAQADATVADTSPDSPNGDGTQAFLSSDADDFGDQRVWFQFDLTGQIPPGAAINRAAVRFYVFQSASEALPIEAVGVPDTWTEAMLTWNVAQGLPVLDATPAAGDQAATTVLEANQAFLWVELDVTDFVVAELAGDAVVSLAVRPTVRDGVPGTTFRLNTRENGTVLAPRLRIDYEGDWPVSPNDVVIIHTNDIHSRLNTHELDFPDSPGEVAMMEEAGGAAYLAAKVVELKQANPEALVVDAGDISEGNPLGDLRGNGGSVAYFQLLNQSLKSLGGRGVDAVVVGNHDVREASMIANMRDPNLNGVFATPSNPNADPDDVPYLAVNLLDEGAAVPQPGPWPVGNTFRPYVVVDINGTRVGVLGYLTDDSAVLTDETEPLIDVKDTVWSDDNPNTVDIKPWVAYLRTVEGADIVVFLSHIGHRRLNATDNALLGNTGDVHPPEIVVSGHWHTWTDTAWQVSNLNYLTTNVEAASYGQYVGQLRVTPEGRYLSAIKHPIDVNDIVIPPSGPVRDVFDAMNAELAALEQEYDALAPGDAEHDPCILVEAGLLTEAQVQAEFPNFTAGDNCPLDLVVGVSADDLELDKDKWNTLSEFPWSGDNTAGAWITDGMVWKVRQLLGEDAADLAIQSGGGIRRDIAAGDLTYREIYEAYPWDDDGMVRVQMTPNQIVGYLQGRFVGASISEDWRVTATDGVIDSVEVDTDSDGNFDTILDPADDLTTYNVLISEYTYENDNWNANQTGGIPGGDQDFRQIDPDPEFLNADGTITTGGNPDASLDLDDAGLEANASPDVANTTWNTLTVPLDGLGIDLSQVVLEVRVDTNSGSENIFIDDVVFSDGGFAVAEQRFDTLPDDAFNTDTFPAGTEDAALSNGGSSYVGGVDGIGFATFWTDTRGNSGPVDPGTEGGNDFIGVNSFSGTNAPDTGPDAVPVGTGVQQNFQFNDGDGLLSLIFEPVDLSLASGALELRLSYWINDTGYEGGDTFSVIVRDTSGGEMEAPDPLEIRNSVIEYTAQFDAQNPLQIAGPRYLLNTEVAGEFDAVVTMTADAETQPYFEAVFIRLLTPSPETVARRNLPGDEYGLDDLVNADGTLNVNNRLRETLLYRSHLGFPDGYLKVGDILRVNGEFGFFEGNHQFVDQEGILAAETEFDIRGNDPALADPDFQAKVADFFSQAHENHLVTFFAERTADNAIRDAQGTEITVFREGGFFTSVFLPGANGDCLQLVGVTTERADAQDPADVRRFRLRDAVQVSSNPESCYPPSSQVEVSGPVQVGAPLSLTATVEDLNGVDGGGQQLTGVITSVAFFYSVDGGPPLLIGIDEDGADGWSIEFLPTESGRYEFYSVATDDDGNVEIAPFYADAAVDVPPSQAVPALPWLALLALGLSVLATVQVLTRRQSRAFLLVG